MRCILNFKAVEHVSAMPPPRERIVRIAETKSISAETRLNNKGVKSGMNFLDSNFAAEQGEIETNECTERVSFSGDDYSPSELDTEHNEEQSRNLDDSEYGPWRCERNSFVRDQDCLCIGGAMQWMPLDFEREGANLVLSGFVAARLSLRRNPRLSRALNLRNSSLTDALLQLKISSPCPTGARSPGARRRRSSC